MNKDFSITVVTGLALVFGMLMTAGIVANAERQRTAKIIQEEADAVIGTDWQDERGGIKPLSESQLAVLKALAKVRGRIEGKAGQ